MRNINVIKMISIKFCVLIIMNRSTHIDCSRIIYGPSAEKHDAGGGVVRKQISNSNDNEIFSRLDQLKAFHLRIKDCIKDKNHTTWNCFKTNMLRAFDELSMVAVIPIWNGVRFVRSNATSTKNYEIIEDRDERQDLQHSTLFDSLAVRLARVLHTHTLQLNFKEMADAYIKEMEQKEIKDANNSTDTAGTARGRRHRYNMLITMMFGVTALGAVLIPMGFQLLSIVSGKALLMAKMALLLASINGLKRVANSGVHYGLYQVPGEHYNGYYDRGDLHHPRNVPGMTIAQPIEFGVRK